MKRGLSEEIQKLILERRKLGYSMKETADDLGLTKGQVAGVLHRARQAALKNGLVDKKEAGNA